MTEVVVADTLTGPEHERSDNEGSTPMPRDLDETRRTADIRSPLTGDYDIPTMLDFIRGRESAMCEACQKEVYTSKGDDSSEYDLFVIRRLVKNVYTVENFVLLCETCANRPSDEWRADVRAKRARERDLAPTWADHFAHWLSDPTATSLFARRVIATVAGMVTIVVLVTILASIAGGLTAGGSTGIAWARNVISATSAAGAVLVDHPWIVGGLVGVAYTAHAIERVHYDPRGYLPRKRPPWLPLTAAGVIAGVGALGLLAVVKLRLPVASWIFPAAVSLWAIGAAGVAWYIDLAIRHDLFSSIWQPARAAWMVAGRVGLLPGLLAITVGVPFADVVAPVTTGLLAAIPAGVALGFAGRRLPYDPRARDRILATLPAWLLDHQQSD